MADVQDKLHSHRSIPQLHPTRIEMVLGNRHRRNGGSCRNGSCRVQTYARFETRNEAFSGQRLGRRRSGAESTKSPTELLPTTHSHLSKFWRRGKASDGPNRNAVPGGAPGRFKRGMGVGISQHHSGQMGYHEGEEGFEKRLSDTRGGGGGGGGGVYGAELEVTADGNILMRSAFLKAARITIPVSPPSCRRC